MAAGELDAMYRLASEIQPFITEITLQLQADFTEKSIVMTPALGSRATALTEMIAKDKLHTDAINFTRIQLRLEEYTQALQRVLLQEKMKGWGIFKSEIESALERSIANCTKILEAIKERVASSGVLVDKALEELSAAKSLECSRYDRYFRILATKEDPETPFHNIAMRLRLKLRELKASVSMTDSGLVNTVVGMLNPKNFSVGTITDFLEAFQQIIKDMTKYKTNSLVSEFAGLILEFIDEINKFPYSPTPVEGCRPALLFPPYIESAEKAPVTSTDEKTLHKG